MSDENSNGNQNFSDDEIPKIPDILRENPRKKAIWISSSILLFSLVITIVFSFVFNSLYLKNLGVNNQGVFKGFPGNFIIEMLFFWSLPVLSILLMVLLARFLAVFYIWLHKIAKFGKFDYSIVDIDYSFIKLKESLNRSIIPTLLSFTIGYWFFQFFNIIESNDLVVETFIFFLYAFMLSPITALLITPLWLLDDSGIISIRKIKPGERKLLDIEGPSTYFVNLLTGSAYSLFLITAIKFIVEIIQSQEPALFGALIYMIFMLLVEWLAIVYLFEIFNPKLRSKLIMKVPAKLVDIEPKVITDQKTVAKLKAIDAILKSSEE